MPRLLSPQKAIYEQRGGQLVKNGFRYASDTNAHWLSQTFTYLRLNLELSKNLLQTRYAQEFYHSDFLSMTHLCGSNFN